jgi:hypothetical protein
VIAAKRSARLAMTQDFDSKLTNQKREEKRREEKRREEKRRKDKIREVEHVQKHFGNTTSHAG